MKAQFTLITFLLLCFTGLNAQTGFIGESVEPLKPQSPLFGKDIAIDNQPIQDQRDVTVCSAFNGWLFAVTTSYDSLAHESNLDLLRSIDSGITWTFLYGGWYPVQYAKIHSLDIVAIGDSISNLKIFESGLYNFGTSLGQSFLYRFNGETGDWEADLIFDFGLNDIALASDNNYPAFNSNPSSLGVLYSIHRNNKDSIIFRSSSNGGQSLDSKQVLATSSNSSFHKVALNYGRSPSYPSGRYFAVWEEQENKLSTLGHIYSAHSNPNFNSPFTTSVQLDALDPSDLNMCRNPNIACQYNNADNDSSNLTEVVLFENFKPASGDYDVTGYYNLQAATTSHFRPLNIAATSNNELQPDICFNPYNSKFMVTYFDSTNKKLPFFINDVNLYTPNLWSVVSQGYNDNSNLIAPYPKVKLNFGNQDGMNAWISEGTSGNGIALFDAPYSTYTGVSKNNIGTSAKLIGSYPNPCSNKIKISFELKNAGKVTIDVLGIMGQPLGTVKDQIYSAGRHSVQYDVSGLPDGNYIYIFKSGDFNAVGKFTVIR